MASSILVIHERIGNWARQLRPRFADRSVRVVETRTGDDLESTLAGADVACPIVVIDLGRRVRHGLDDLLLAVSLAPDALVLVLDPVGHDDVGLIAREAGATHVMAGPVTPPEVATLLGRWLTLAQQRSEAVGFAGRSVTPDPEPWNALSALLSPRTA